MDLPTNESHSIAKRSIWSNEGNGDFSEIYARAHESVYSFKR